MIGSFSPYVQRFNLNPEALFLQTSPDFHSHQALKRPIFPMDPGAVRLPVAQPAFSYSFVTGNDESQRDPIRWQLWGTLVAGDEGGGETLRMSWAVRWEA